jgi:competence protein ComEA
MLNKTESSHRRFYLFFLLIGLIGVSLAVGVIPAYAQAQKILIDLNTASEKDLESIKGVGPATVKKIIAGRPYKSVEDLKRVGIPDKTIESMKPQVKVGPAAAAALAPAKPAAEAKPAAPAKPTTPAKPATPPATAKETAKEAKAFPKTTAQTPAKLALGQKVNLNTATKEQLEALPEIGPVKAQAIIDGRPYKTPEDVMKVKGIKEGTYNKIKDSITVQ